MSGNPRFKELNGGWIYDGFTGRTIAKVSVDSLDTTTAGRVADVLIRALHNEFGPLPRRQPAATSPT